MDHSGAPSVPPEACSSTSDGPTQIPCQRKSSIQHHQPLSLNTSAPLELDELNTPTEMASIPAEPGTLIRKDSMAISVASTSKDSVSTTEKKKKKEPSIPPSKSRLGAFLSRHPWLMGWNHEDWWPCWIGLFLFMLVAISVHYGVEEAKFEPWTTNPFDSLKGKGNLALLVLFPLQGMLVWLALFCVKAKAWPHFWKGYLVVYAFSFLSKWLAAQQSIKSASLGDSIWAILFGALIRNILAGKPLPDGRAKPLPPCLKVAQQTELYIASSLVLLCINYNDLKPLAPRALFVSWIDTPTLFILVAMLGVSWLKIDLQTSIIMSGATFICGSSAAIALSSSLGATAKADLPIAIISVFTIPSIIALPYIAKAVNLSATVAGAWFGGCIDSTGAVIAASTIYDSVDKTAVETSAVVKMVQNVLIGPISVGVAAVWSKREQRRQEQLRDTLEDDALRRKSDFKPLPYHVLLWTRFPKFVLGFLATAVLFNTVVPSYDRDNVNDYSFMVGEWYSTMSFVSIGLGLQFHELRREAKLLLRMTALYALAQMVDILSTLGLAYIAFVLF
ncbi:hypothetical protein DFQ27_001893 [Actinomortierella ambigua]|uniref:Uncharacterized protein n=1 Tax=Actinomortierella ambigua TaxID=1343610 RepID=A0A9P6Q8S5_9FUNG|nr:hypothetical protein DFQ27_001893 [Actinomortierella ambigua]